MAETTNYKLHLTDDASEKFLDWREKMNGVNDSNMQKIDAALGEKADHSVPILCTLLADGWTGDAAPYLQTITVVGLGKTQNGNIGMAHGTTADERTSARRALLSVSEQQTNQLTILADGEKPAINLPVEVTLID